jgi:hypothetical protein
MFEQVAGRGNALRDGWATSAALTAHSIDHDGYARLPDAVDADWLAAAKGYVNSLATADARDVMHRDPALRYHRVIAALVEDPRLLGFLEDVAVALYPSGNPADRDVDIGLRVINGPNLDNRPLWFHYDATVLTVVLPIEMPDSDPGQSGELIMCRNKRPFRRFATANVIEKSVVQTDAYRRRFRRHLAELIPDVVALRPGDIYLLCGYRSYHATLPCPPGGRRVTLVMHYKDVHAGSRLVRNAKSFRRRIVR